MKIFIQPVTIKLIFLIVLIQFIAVSSSLAAPLNDLWLSETEDNKKIKLHFFWSKACPYCQKAKPFIKNLVSSHDWIELKTYELSEHQENVKFFLRLTKIIGKQDVGVPAFAFCEKLMVGFFNDETTGTKLQNELLKCKNEVLGNASEEKPLTDQKSKVSIPFLGNLDSTQLSLPVFTIVIAGLDAFNPCAFFVLLLLLSLLVNAKDRKRMLLIGGIFVFFSGFIYFIFMAAWLNVFLYLGELRIITIIAAFIAIGVSTINIKDYFFFKEGVSLSIPDEAKPSLYKRIRKLVNASRLSAMLFGTVVLAVVANTYELLCTSGFPMIFTRVLTLRDLSLESYYLYLAFYNVIYIIPLLVIVLIFVFTLGARKLTEKEGRVLKLVSGLMMLILGIVLLVKPDLLNNFLAALGMLLVAIVLSLLIQFTERFYKKTI